MAYYPEGALSRGDAALFMRFPPPDYREKIWDHCAGYVIVQEAGGKVWEAIELLLLKRRLFIAIVGY